MNSNTIQSSNDAIESVCWNGSTNYNWKKKSFHRPKAHNGMKPTPWSPKDRCDVTAHNINIGVNPCARKWSYYGLTSGTDLTYSSYKLRAINLAIHFPCMVPNQKPVVANKRLPLLRISLFLHCWQLWNSTVAGGKEGMVGGEVASMFKKPDDSEVGLWPQQVRTVQIRRGTKLCGASLSRNTLLRIICQPVS